MGTEFPWRWGRGTISANLDVIWGMSDKMYPIRRSQAHDGIAITLQAIDDVNVVDISGHVMTLDVEYRADMAHQGVATVIACGSNYNVLYFGDQPS